MRILVSTGVDYWLILVLIGPVKAFNDNVRTALSGRASLVTDKGMSAIAQQIATGGTSEKTNSSRPLNKAFVLASVLSAKPAGYAQACRALAEADDPQYEKINAPTLIIAAAEDKTSPDATTSSLAESIPGASRVVLKETGHWLLVEDPEQVARALQDFTVVNGR